VINLLLSLLMGLCAHAQVDEGPLFGPEFTFFGPSTFDPSGKYLNLGISPLNKFGWAAERHLVKGQPEGAQFTMIRGVSYFEFASPNKWRFTASTDSGVIEVKMLPMTVSGYEHFQSDIQDAIFVTAANQELFPGLFLGGGHINMDAKYLLRRPLLMRNFLADLLVNHVELFMGIFGYDTNNSLPQIMASEDMYSVIKGAFDQFDSVPSPTAAHIEVLYKTISDRLHGAIRDPYEIYWEDPIDRGSNPRNRKFVAVNLLHLFDEDAARLELRAVRAQTSMDVWIRQIRLLRNRLRYLSTFHRPIPIKLHFDLSGLPKLGGTATAAHAMQPPISAAQALEHFRSFVEESGERLEDHLDYVWPKWITDGDVARYLQKTNNCDSALAQGDVGR
jgi:hypothetical protein